MTRRSSTPTDAWILPAFNEDSVEIGARVRASGLDYGGDGIVLARTKDTLSVKWPGGTHWAGRGERGYHSPTIAVYHIEHEAGDRMKCIGLIEWDLKRKPQGEKR